MMVAHHKKYALLHNLHYFRELPHTHAVILFSEATGFRETANEIIMFIFTGFNEQ
jgi:hypothetical protein